MARLKRIQFGTDYEDDEALIQEILAREKTATVCRADEYDLPHGEYDDAGWEVGDIVKVCDKHRILRCLIRVTEVYNLAFGEIPEKLWRGEACTSAEHFQDAHRRCWPDHDLTPDFELTATHFELLGTIQV